MKLFLDVMYDDTKNARKIKSCDYNNEGKYPIIDQSSKNVIGYTDEIDGLYKDVPVITFGDHTRRFKLVEEPFFIGADGTKVLKLCSSVYDYKFIYYYLLYKKIPNTGYNRHFKWIKELEFPEIPRSIQSDIVKKFEILNNLISSKNKLLELFDILLKSRFVEMFGNPIINDKKYPVFKLKDISRKIGSGVTPRGGDSNYIDKGVAFIRSMNVYNNTFKKENLVYIDESLAKQFSQVELFSNDLLLNITGASVARCCTVPEDILPARVNQHVCIIRQCRISNVFLEYCLTNESYQEYLLLLSNKNGATREALTKTQVENLEVIVPRSTEITRFVKIVHQINKLKVDVQKSIDETQLLMDSLMQEYFG